MDGFCSHDFKFKSFNRSIGRVGVEPSLSIQCVFIEQLLVFRLAVFRRFWSGDILYDPESTTAMPPVAAIRWLRRLCRRRQGRDDFTRFLFIEKHCIYMNVLTCELMRSVLVGERCSHRQSCNRQPIFRDCKSTMISDE